MIEAKNLTLHYGGSQILHGIDLVARPGEVTCVMGNNGVGKTSLMNLLAGRHPRSGGDITWDGKPLGRLSAQRMARMGVGYVPQGRAIFPMLTVRENLETGFACLPRGDRRIPDAIFDSFPVLAEMAHRRGGDLSGGQQQQLAIARALITRPRVLLLDEPTEGIQPNIIAQIGRVIAGLRDRGDMAIVLVEQFFDFAWDLGDRFLVMERGRAVLQGPKSDLARSDLHARLAGHASA
ncbi:MULTISPECIES: urea ABC transporter ATP-binding subunit UrtE [Paracoccus]|uniref:urea ABC transporter ATP-binding subunit UrtE n=1 Tax=Paracoccus TaxID=265 RepID=UPI0005E83145|nr:MULTISPECIES: urea ABC transporter ATP-binding subunit UrtE [Paracoccus]KIX18224.1 urea ABC transporter ATP-binding protein [Paracoccus sp. 228]MCO6364333.1 urea ABC transporter ATP-binding subunit UrtE [Paracoccus sp. 08]TYP67225.1 amino acid/amide ABC transporter ATP-binding protein 2 (HAAT family) [Stutzerimonas stutzeri]|tara:strand:+ start:2825 stop:3532 length:708 start_codon:yes stop_codon:yes gene_type:complete